MKNENSIHLRRTPHPDKDAVERFNALVGLDEERQDLVDHLVNVLDPERVKSWEKKHHPRGLGLLRRLQRRPPLVVLAGDVGCGKTELATSVGTPVARALDERVSTFETPSDIRGGGLVGELSLRITAAFEAARAELGESRGILVIDEGDDLATSREQNQAHHEDRAGVNVLIKQIDALAKDRVPLAVILITNRLAALDPALMRRAHVIQFRRPNADARRTLFERLLEGVTVSRTDLDALVAGTEREVAFTYSDLVTRLAEPALRLAIREGVPLNAKHLLRLVQHVKPTPIFRDHGV